MKIVHLSASNKGGAGIAAFRIHKALLQYELDSHFICLNQGLSDPTVSNLKQLSLLKNHSSFSNKLFDKIKWRLKHHFNFYLSTQEKMEEKFKTISSELDCETATLPYSIFNVLEDPFLQDADIIHLHWVAGMLNYPSFFKHNKKPVVWTLHDMNPFQGIFHYKEDEDRNRVKTAGLDKDVASIKMKLIQNRKSALAMVAPSEWLLHEATKSKTFKGVKTECIYYPLDMQRFSPDVNETLLESLQIPTGNTILLFVADWTITKRKGLDLLLAALKKLNQTTITLLVIGNFKQDEYEGNNVIRLGTIADEKTLCSYYSIADAFILPSREDNLPNVMLESMACGTPVISFDVGGMATIIENGFNGLKATKTNAEELSKVIEQFIHTKKNFSRDKIREFAIAHFSENTIAKKYQDVYEDLLASDA